MENAGPENGGPENGGPEIVGPSTCAENAGIMSVISDRKQLKVRLFTSKRLRSHSHY